MPQATGRLQESFLNLCRKEHIKCSVYLVNGVQLRGLIMAFDAFTLLLEDEQRQQLIFKHAITSIQPMEPLPARWSPGGPER